MRHRRRGALVAGLLLVACGGAEVRAPAVAAPPVPSFAAVGPDRSALPTPGPARMWSPPAPTAWKLDSGARVLHHTYGKVPLVSLLLVLPRGSETDPPGLAGLTHLTADLLDEGAGGSSALELSERLRSLATDFGISTSVDAVVLGMNTIEENFAASVELLSHIVRRPGLDEHEFARRKAQVISQAVAAEADPHTGRRAAMYRALFGGGYAGTLPSGTPDTLQAITLADVRAHYERLVVSEGATFVVTGGIERAQVVEHLRRGFGDWKGQANVQPRGLLAPPGSGKLYFVNYPAAAQSVIGVVRRAPGADADDLFAATVFNRSFGDSFTSRVNLNLREAKGYTYGAASTFQRFREAGYFGIFSDVRTDVTRQSLDEVLKELSALCGDKPLTARERDDAVGGLLLGYPGAFESIGQLGANFAQLPIQGRPVDWFERWPARVAAVTLEQASAAARDYCQRWEYSIVVAGDKAKVAPTLEGIGFDLVEVDARGQLL